MKLVQTLISFLLVALLAACGGGGGGAGTPTLGGNDSTTSVPLFTTAPSDLTLLPGASSTAFSISGGRSGYSVTSNNPAVASVTATENRFTVSAVAAGDAVISIKDAIGTTVLLAVKVASPGSDAALFTTAPASLALNVGASSSTFGISGGKPAYSVTTSNPAVAAVTSTASGFTVVGLAEGSAVVTVKDSVGAQASMSVSVSVPGSGVSLFTSSPASLSLAVGATTPKYSIGGGRPAYTVATSNAQVATVVTSDGGFSVVGVAEGSAVVSVKDATGAQVAISVAVAGSSTALFTTAPGSLSLSLGATSSPYAIAGGKPGYTVVSSNPQAVSVTASANGFTVTALSEGVASISVKDSVGTTVSLAVTVAGSDTPLFSTAPGTLTLGVGASSLQYAISGGRPAYSVASSNPAVVGVVFADTGFTVQGLAEGSAVVTIKDAAGAEVSLTVAVTVTSTPLFTTAPGSLSLPVGASSSSFAIVGGRPGYSVVSSNPFVASVAVADGGFIVTGVADGTALVSVKDSAGAEVTLSVTVNGSTTALFTTAPATLSLSVGTVTSPYAIAGGKPGYSVVSSSPDVVAVVVGSDGAFSVTALREGTATISVKDSAGTEVTVSVAVTASAAPLFTSAPADLTLVPGASSSQYVISGGRSGYTVETNNPAVATVTAGTDRFTVVAQAVGQAVVTVKDADGTEVSLAVRVAFPDSASALFTTAPATLTLGQGTTSAQFAIGGGRPAYSVSTSNPAVASVVATAGGFSVTGLGEGTAVVWVKDAAGAEVSVGVTVTVPGSGQALFTTAPASLTLAPGASSPTYAINGGKPGYTVATSNAAVATVVTSSGGFAVVGVAEGSAVVSVKDSTGAQVTLSVAVAGSGTALFTTAPGSVSLSVGATSTTFAIAGGKPGYTVVSGNPSVATVAVSGTGFTVTAVAAGSATISVKDSVGAQVTVSVTVVGSDTRLFTTAPASLTLAVGANSATYTISGGQPGYSVSTSNPAVASVTASGTGFSVRGVAEGSAVVSVKDAAGTEVTLSVAVAGSDTALFTTAPGSLGLPVGATSTTFAIAGGKPGYTVVSGNPFVASVNVAAGSFTVTGVADGSAVVTIKDSVGSEVVLSVTVTGSGGTALFTSAPGSVALSVGSTSSSFAVAGGKSPYTIVSGAPDVASVAIAVDGSFTLTGRREGSALVSIKDSVGTEVTVAVTVSGTPLFTTAPSSLVLNPGATSPEFVIAGGTPAYSVLSSNAAVATVTRTAGGFSVTAVGEGTAVVTVKDAVGAEASVGVAVQLPGAGVSLFTTAPGSLTLAAGSSSASFSISGGRPGYTVVTSNPSVATVTASGSSFSIQAVAAGSALVSIKDSIGAEVNVAVTVPGGAQATLFTTAPPSVTLAVGTTSQEYAIFGGAPGYTVVSDNPAVATVGINGSRFVVNGVAGGKASVTIKDSLGATLTVSFTVGSATPLFTTAPADITMAVGVTRSYVIVGGSAPYTAVAGNGGVAEVTVSGSGLQVRGESAGTSSVVVRDALGATVTLNVTVGSGTGSSPLFTSAPGSIVVAPGTTPTFVVNGGVQPYRVSTSNAAVATASISGGNLAITGVRSGSASIVVTDNTGARLEVAVAVETAPVVALYTTAPGAVSLTPGSSATFGIGGGVGPYVVGSSSASVVTASVSGTQLILTAQGNGSAQVSVFDSTGASVTLSVTVAPVLPLSTTAPASVSLGIGATPVYTIVGGTAPYTATSSNVAVATVSVSGSALTVTGGAAGTAQVEVRDAGGTLVGIGVTVAPLRVLATTAPDAVVIAPRAPGNVASYTISGGVSPYYATSGNTTVVQAAVSGSTLTLTGAASGSTTVLVRDSAGTGVSIAVTASALPALYTSAPPTVSLAGGTVASYALLGGAGGYTATSSDTRVAAVAITGSTLTVTAGVAGTASVVVLDAAGASVTIGVTVGPAVPLFSSAPATITLRPATPQVYSVGGGRAPYVVTSSNTAVVTATVTSSTLTVTAVGTGTGSIVVSDADGARVTLGVTVSATAGTPLVVTPLSASASAGDVLNFTIQGGSPVYNVVVNNPAIASVSAVSPSGAFTATLLNAGATSIAIVDSQGQTQEVALTVTEDQPLLRLSPSSIAVAETTTDPLTLQIRGGTAPYMVYTSNEQLSSVGLSGDTVQITAPSGRCISAATPGYDAAGNTKTFGDWTLTFGSVGVVITVVDSAGRSANSALIIVDTGTCP